MRLSKAEMVEELKAVRTRCEILAHAFVDEMPGFVNSEHPLYIDLVKIQMQLKDVAAKFAK